MSEHTQTAETMQVVIDKILKQKDAKKQLFHMALNALYDKQHYLQLLANLTKKQTAKKAFEGQMQVELVLINAIKKILEKEYGTQEEQPKEEIGENCDGQVT